jgi:hypothetical protein
MQVSPMIRDFIISLPELTEQHSKIISTFFKTSIHGDAIHTLLQEQMQVELNPQKLVYPLDVREAFPDEIRLMILMRTFKLI